MKIGFELEEHESKVTPIKIAEALIEDGFSHNELKEIVAYLSVYTKYNKPDGFMASTHNVFGR